ncbi:hypothetical protein PLESTB_000690600 [Pleodorina starrii]|uniref:Uncharacterized protein n=1 Tax=Pleodorina starrii TaxID=330485 RepID=A0A9W6BK80_9CHLO|nr:hypothetical protein PLESTB_000690600 [Pleodorina starrii]GLC65236.1 hypothetical protein PLESTF_000266800 [Pleodorina starrii]
MPGRRQQPPMKKPYMSGGDAGNAAMAAAIAAHEYASVDPETCTSTLPSWSCHSQSYRGQFGGCSFWRTLFGRRRSNKVAPTTPAGRRQCVVIKAANRMPDLVDVDDERTTGTTTQAGGHVTTGEGLPAAYHVLRRVAVGLK